MSQIKRLIPPWRGQTVLTRFFDYFIITEDDLEYLATEDEKLLITEEK